MSLLPERKKLMKRPARSLLTIFSIITCVAALLVGLFFLIRPTQAGQVVWGSSVNVAATAQAIQFDRRQAELTATAEVQTTKWQAQIAAQQQALTELDHNGQRQLDQQQSELNQLQGQIDQLAAQIQTTQVKIAGLKQSIKADQANYETELTVLAGELSQRELELEDQLSLTQSQLQAARTRLAELATPPPPPVGSDNGGSDGQSDPPEQRDDNSKPETDQPDQSDDHHTDREDSSASHSDDSQDKSAEHD